MSPLTNNLHTDFDAEDLIDRMMGSDVLARRVVSVFLVDAPLQLNALALALEKADCGEVRAIAHSMKGSAANAGAAELSSVAARLEKLAEAGDLAAAQQLLPTVTAVFDTLAPLLNNFCRQ